MSRMDAIRALQARWTSSLASRVPAARAVVVSGPATTFEECQEKIGIALTCDDAGVELVTVLETEQIEIAGQSHDAYFWLRAHSGLGDGAEAAHFKWAVRGVHRAFDYVPESLHEELRAQIDLGYLEFAADHEVFFTKVNSDPLPSA